MANVWPTKAEKGLQKSSIRFLSDAKLRQNYPKTNDVTCTRSPDRIMTSLKYRTSMGQVIQKQKIMNELSASNDFDTIGQSLRTSGSLAYFTSILHLTFIPKKQEDIPDILNSPRIETWHCRKFSSCAVFTLLMYIRYQPYSTLFDFATRVMKSMCY